MKERIWTLDSPVVSKIEFQPLEPETDAQLHKERMITVRTAAENLPLEFNTRKCPRRNEDILETLRRDEVSGRDQDRAENCSDSTRAMSSTDDPGDDSQQSPDCHTRPRADSSAVARFNVADLEPASLRERECEKLQG